MTNTVTISLSLGSGPKAQELALRIKAWAGSRPLSLAIRELIEQELAIKDIPRLDMGQKAQTFTPEK